MKAIKAKARMPREVPAKILRIWARGEPAVALPTGRVFSLARYQKMQQQAKENKPWTRRNSQRGAAEPLGAVEGAVLSTLSRQHIYE